MTHETQMDDGWRIGVLFSRSGPTGVTESEHFLGTALAIEEINQLGGVLSRPLIPVAYDPRGDATEYRQLATRLLLEDEVNVIFGCSRSSSRKAVLPVIERNNALLWYCSFYEGFEYSPNVIYTGAVPNQNNVPLAAYLLQNRGRKLFFVGADYIYPRESNRIMRDLVEQHGGEVLDEVYLPLEASRAEVEEVLADIQAAQPDAVFSTMVGQSARLLYQLYRDFGLDPLRTPIASLSMVEEEIRQIGPLLCEGHITAATYFGSVASESNRRFIALWRSRFGDRPTSMWSELAYAQIHLFAQALQRSGSLDRRKLVEAAHRVRFEAPEGPITVDPENNHCSLTPRIGICRSDGQFDIVWEAMEPVRPDPYFSTFGFSEFWLR
ncbi:amino acid/amide ABC transporter substrate-binding protein (HAAT family) [Delftia sp. 60]|uniref:transporter substrate-binding domain-containing protein n=1 Tax=unclassified Delftia TaxID=2613839 RepID=UPI0008068E98|nr:MULTISPECIES: transporter substrate-binding domain-containing protein [unclassified Delftia]OBY83146.1 amino acid ABC transporter substrate-binding protein [Delftia sp. JD2]PIF38789.1 amino acid/amide ABC transporter substrate-binding protein (HAAT family) [Burkholderiales bacterium 23]PIF66032.1 amino acid/amide ABC transporter substrate-binding protein (HAAT family) [Delftia sp. 60]